MKSDRIETDKIKSAISWPTINYFKNVLSKTEQTEQESSMVPDSQSKPFNSDDLYDKDNTYGIYEDMIKDDQVSVALQLKKDMVLGSGWDIVCDNEGQDEYRQELEFALRDTPDRPFEEMLEEILTAYDFGFSITEKIFTIRENNLMGLKDLKTRHPATWLIHQDTKGNVTKYEQYSTQSMVDINPDVLIHYINRPKFQNPYGVSDLRAAYAAYFTKKHIMRYYAIFLEKAASPTPIARYDSKVSPDAVSKIYNAIKKLQTRTAMTIPKEIEVEFLEASSTGDAFIKGLNIFNMMIGRSLLLPDLLGFQGSETTGGSRSLGDKQMEVFFKHIERRRKSLETLINKHIIEPIAIYNWGKLEDLPKFKFKEIESEDEIIMANTWIEAQKGHIYKPNIEEVNHFRKLIRFPESNELEEDVIEKDDNPQTDIPNPEDEQESIEDMLQENDKLDFAYNLFGDHFDDRIDYKTIETQMESNLSQFNQDSSAVINELFDDFFKSLSKKKNLTTKTAESVSIKNVSKLNTVIKKHLNTSYKQAKDQAQKEVEKQDFAEPIIDKEFLDVLDSETFEYVNDWKYNIDKRARVEIIAAIKDGRPISSVIEILGKSKKEAVVSTERYARTKFTETMNKGRLAYFESTNIVQGYRYSAILDGVTTVICQGLHGKWFKSGNQPIPPMHFNCRSLLIPVTKFEKMIETKKIGNKSTDAFIDKNKGKGFPKQ